MLSSLLHQSKPLSARAAWPQHLAAEMRQEISPPPCLGQSSALTAASLGPLCHGQLEVTGAGTMHLQEVNVPLALGPMETSRMWVLLPGPDRMNLAACDLAMLLSIGHTGKTAMQFNEILKPKQTLEEGKTESP